MTNPVNPSGFFSGTVTPPEVNSTDALVNELTAMLKTAASANASALAAQAAAASAANNALISESNVAHLAQQSNTTLAAATAAVATATATASAAASAVTLATDEATESATSAATSASAASSSQAAAVSAQAAALASANSAAQYAADIANGTVASTLAALTSGTLPAAAPLSGNEELVVSGYPLKSTTTLAIAQLAVQTGYQGSFNFSPNHLPHWRAAMGRVRSASGSAKVLCIGDSTTAGAWSNGSYSGNAFVKSYPKQLAALLASAGVAANGEGFMGGHNWGGGNAGLTGYDPRISLGGSWAINPGVLSLGCETYSPATGSGTFGFTPSVPVDTFEVYYAQNDSLGSFTTAFNGGATLATVATAGAGGVAKAVIKGALGANTLNITPVGNGSLYLIGVVAYNSAVNQVSVINAGWVGGIASNIADLSSPWASAQVIPTIAPDLTIIDCSINDANTGTPVSTYQGYMQQLITQALRFGDVILMTGAPSNTPAATNGQLAAIVGTNYGLALSNFVPLVDTVGRWVSWASANPLGFYGTGENVHPSGAGYSDIAQSVARSLLSV